MEIHEVCEMFPEMQGTELQELAQDIARHGLREPIWTYKGRIIDGRNRFKVCLLTGAAPRYREWDGKGSLVEFVVSLNLHRRHLTKDQREAIAAEMSIRLTEEEAKAKKAVGGKAGGKVAGKGRPKGPDRVVANLPQPYQVDPKSKKKPAPKSRDKAAAAMKVKPRGVQNAIAVATKAPDLHAKVKAGEMTQSQAKREIQRAAKRAELEAKAAAAQAAAPADVAPAWEVVAGDCVERLRAVEPGSARLVFADPPYNQGVDYGGGAKADRLSDYDYLAWCARWIDASWRALAADGSLWVLISHEYAAAVELILKGGIGLRFPAGEVLGEGAFHVRAWPTWYESFGVNCSNNFNRTSRRLLYCVKDPKKFVFNAAAVSRPSDRQAKYGDKRADPGGKVWDDVWGINPPIARLVGNAAERLPDFPTQLPLALLEPIVGCASEPGDLVIDPFTGSGTTGVAAVRLGRRYLGIEKSAKFAGLARTRLTSLNGATHAT